ncbi:urea ABC transporter permease subunit UrtB [Rhodobacteraceae bacterium PA1-206B]
MPAAARAQGGMPLDAVLAEHRDQIEKPSRQTIGPVIDAIVETRDPAAAAMLQAWGDRVLGLNAADGRFYIIARQGDDWALTALDGTDAGTAPRGTVTELRPNAGVRELIAAALVEFTLTDPDPARRAQALDSIARSPSEAHIEPLRDAALTETDPVLKARIARLERLVTLQHAPLIADRIAAMEGFRGDISLDVRAALNPLLATTRKVATELPEGTNIAAVLTPGENLDEAEAYALLVSAGLAPPHMTTAEQKTALAANIVDGAVGGVPLAELASQAGRDRAWEALEAAGSVPAAATDAEVAEALSAHVFFDEYRQPNAEITAAARDTLDSIETKVALMQAADLGLDAVSLASIYFLAAIGLAITFGVMGVINMAHGEFIMMGAYTGYVVQLFIPDRTVSILIALPLAFAVTFLAGVAMERLVIRHLYKRPLETLLATFGISIALQQIAKNIFGTQARPLTAPAWLDGQLAFNDIVAISYIRVAIFVMAMIFLIFFLWLMKRTRLGLEVRAVTQNPSMAASMGIDPDRINMLTFGLGSGIAGIAGVAIGLFAKVTSELGSDYIVQSFMTVVVGGVGNIWGTLAGAALIGGLQKVIEWLNPANTLAAQTYMILFIILFIQFRPRGIIALRGRAAGD